MEGKYVDLRQTFLALKLKSVKGPGYENYNTKEVKKEHEEEVKADVETEEVEEQEAPVPLVIHVNNILHSTFSNVEVYIKNQRIYNSNGLYAHKSYISNHFKGAISEYKGFCIARGTTMKTFLMKLWSRFCLSLFFSQRE